MVRNIVNVGFWLLAITAFISTMEAYRNWRWRSEWEAREAADRKMAAERADHAQSHSEGYKAGYEEGSMWGVRQKSQNALASSLWESQFAKFVGDTKRFEEATARAKGWKILVDAAPTTRAELELATERIHEHANIDWPEIYGP